MERNLLYALGLVVLLTGCSGANKTAEVPETAPVAPPSAPTTTNSSSTVGIIEVQLGSDQDRPVFNPSKISAQAGESITWKMNTGGPHNVVFDPDKSPDAETAKAMSNPTLIEQKGYSIVTVIPTGAKPGVYPFACTTHQGEGMVGELTITAQPIMKK